MAQVPCVGPPNEKSNRIGGSGSCLRAFRACSSWPRAKPGTGLLLLSSAVSEIVTIIRSKHASGPESGIRLPDDLDPDRAADVELATSSKTPIIASRSPSPSPVQLPRSRQSSTIPARSLRDLKDMSSGRRHAQRGLDTITSDPGVRDDPPASGLRVLELSDFRGHWSTIPSGDAENPPRDRPPHAPIVGPSRLARSGGRLRAMILASRQATASLKEITCLSVSGFRAGCCRCQRHCRGEEP